MNCRQPKSVCSPIIHETLDHDCTTTCQNKGSVLPRVNDELSMNFVHRRARNCQLHTQRCRIDSVISFRFAIKITSPWSEAGALTPTLEAELPFLDEFVGLAHTLHLDALAVRHTASQAVCCPGRCLQGVSQGTDAVVDVAFGPGMFIHCTSGPLPSDRHLFLEFCGLTLYFECSLQRLLIGHSEFIMDCSAIANFPEGVGKFWRLWLHVWPNNQQILSLLR